MAKTLEVGRAVLASTTQHLELWLSTLITLLPSQDSIDVEQLSSHYLLRLLSSGDIWVDRGNGMRVELALTCRGEPFPKPRLQMLREKIIQAPIWSQLKLKPTVPVDDVLQDGIAHVTISYADDSSTNERQCHRILSDVPAAAIRPPEGVSTIQLHVVRFTMDILGSKQRLQMKRSNTMTHETRTQMDDSCDHRNEDVETLLHEVIETPQFDVTEADYTVKGTIRKRKRPGRQAPSRTFSAPGSLFDSEVKSNKRPATIATSRIHDQDVITDEQLVEIQSMVEGAMRLSIYGNGKLPVGIKVKANTFDTGLADVAPILWRPGYISALSQRAHLAPTVCRSLCHAIGAKATSISLRDKLKKLTGSYSGNSPHSRIGQSIAIDRQLERTSSPLPVQLWSHLQKSLLARPGLPLQSFATCDAAAADPQVSDEILVPTELLCEASAAPSANEEHELSSPVMEGIKPSTIFSVQEGLQQGYDTAVHSEARPIAFEDDLLLDVAPMNARSCYGDGDCEDLRFGASARMRSPDYANPRQQIIGGRSTSSHAGDERAALLQSANTED